MTVLPFHYCFGTSLLHTHLRVGGVLVLDHRFMYPETVLQRMQETECTGFAGVPSHYQILLRRSSLDELPQLFNVLRGEMSLVGPRPHPVDDYELYSIEHLRRLDVNPGLTGLWQVTARKDPSFETNMALDLEYIENWSLGLDLKILLKTVPAVFRAEGY